MNDKIKAGPSSEGKKNTSILARIREALALPSLQRLRNTIPVFRVELDALRAQDSGTSKDPGAFKWAESAVKLLNLAIAAQEVGDADQGWRCLKAADRFMWYGLDRVDYDTLMSRAKVIANEAADEGKGLSKWRRDSIKALLKDIDAKDCQGQPVIVHVNQVIEAKRLLDEHYDNVYQKLTILRKRLEWLFVAGLAFLVVWFVILPPVPLMLTASVGSDPLALLGASPAKFWGMVVLAGILGALISSFTSAIGTDVKKSNIPAELSTLTITSARLMVAALSALAVTLFLSSGILMIQQLTYAFVIAIAVVSGFTDRLLLSAIERTVKPG